MLCSLPRDAPKVHINEEQADVSVISLLDSGGQLSCCYTFMSCTLICCMLCFDGTSHAVSLYTQAPSFTLR